MTFRRDTAARLAAVLWLGLAAPAAAQEQSTGATGGTEATVGKPALTVRPGVLLNRTLSIQGLTEMGDAGRPVHIELREPTGAWRPIADAVVGSDGAFTAAWRTDTAGRVTLRATIERPTAEATAAAAPLITQTTVFEPAVASWYGPGFFGRMTACKVKLTKRTLGVAHKSLPCGSEVEIYHRGRTVTVPVIDRGPFHPGRDWDLTRATAEALGVTSTVRVGVLAPEPTAFKRGRSHSSYGSRYTAGGPPTRTPAARAA